MLDFKEIEKMAYLNNPLQNCLSQPEQFAYLSMRILYQEFQKGDIDKDKAQQERILINKSFDEAVKQEQERLMGSWRLNDMRIRLAGFSKEVESGECERCKQMMQIFDGRTK